MARLFLRLFILILVLAAMSAGWMWWSYGHRQVVADGEQIEFALQKGRAGATSIASVLNASGVDVGSRELALIMRLRGDAARIKAGTYVIAGPATLQDVLGQMVSGQAEKGMLMRLIDGWNFREVRAALKRTPELEDTISAMSDAELMEALGAPGMSPEGRFAPDTYSYRPGSKDIELLRRAFVLQQRRLDAAWENRADGLTLKTPEDLLTLASIVEKETGNEEDREMVASVFHNRLRVGMPLQSDPTTIFGLGEKFDGNLRRADLRDRSPYNTYVHRGLPPSPIALPSLRALEATARPATSDKFYFVARGDGRSEFSADLKSHNRAVNQYQRGQAARQQRGAGAAASTTTGRGTGAAPGAPDAGQATP